MSEHGTPENPLQFPTIRDHFSEMLMATQRLFTSTKAKYRLHVITGDRVGAGTDANVYVILYDRNNTPSKIISPRTIFSNDHERGATTSVDLFDLQIEHPFVKIDVWRDNFGDWKIGKIGKSFFGNSHHGDHGAAAWFLDRVEVEVLENGGDQLFVPVNANRKVSSDSTNAIEIAASTELNVMKKFVFPLQRWIKENRRYTVDLYDSVLPQSDPRPISRADELERRRSHYRCRQVISGGPQQIDELPSDEKFSDHYYWTFVTDKIALKAKTEFLNMRIHDWKSLKEIEDVCTKGLGKPKCLEDWETDSWFGLQRIQGVNPLVIKLCEAIPDRLDVTEETVKGLLGEQTLQEAVDQKKIFICDLEILENLPIPEDRKLACPLALFHLKNDNQLLPIAIQLCQQKGPLNPVFTPLDDRYTWLVAKMYYNNAEAQHHQGISHLGLTHLIMEGVCVCTHRQLSPSHPIFKLIAPHFLFLLAINSRGLEKLISVGGWVDKCMTQGVEGIYELIKRGHDRYNFMQHGNVETEIKNRGLTSDVMPYYPYRDDATALYKVIRNYVTNVVHHYYDSNEKLIGDFEIQKWRIELSKAKECCGIGIQGIPGDNEQGFTEIEHLIDTVTVIISTCSLGHASSNFQQYEQYAFLPNYPGILMAHPPTSKCTYTEKELLEIIPDKTTTLETMLITKLLSKQGTNKLGDFEMQYLYDPVDVAAADIFRKELAQLSLEIKRVNMDRQYNFNWLDPDIVPNAISI